MLIITGCRPCRPSKPVRVGPVARAAGQRKHDPGRAGRAVGIRDWHHPPRQLNAGTHGRRAGRARLVGVPWSAAILVLCHRPAIIRSPRGKPCHWTCATAWTGEHQDPDHEVTEAPHGKCLRARAAGRCPLRGAGATGPRTRAYPSSAPRATVRDGPGRRAISHAIGHGDQRQLRARSAKPARQAPEPLRLFILTGEGSQIAREVEGHLSGH
jgi:hypothetical protein